MKVLLFEDVPEFASIITGHLLKRLPDLEILWFGAVTGHTQLPIPHPFSGTGDCVLRTKCKLVTKAGESEIDIDLLPGDLAGAVLDIYADGVRVGENIARWLQYAEFTGPILLYSGQDLPPVFPALPMIFSYKKRPNTESDIEPPLAAFCQLLPSPAARVNSHGLPRGGGEALNTLRWKKMVWDWFPANADMSQFAPIFGAGVPLQYEAFASNPLLARGTTVDELRALRERTRNTNLFYLLLERERAGVGPYDALQSGIVYLDQDKLSNEPLRFATATAEEFVYRYTALARKYPEKTMDAIEKQDSQLLSAFMVVYARAVAFAGGSRPLFKTTKRGKETRPGWIEELAGRKLTQKFETTKTLLLASAKKLSLLPQDLQIP